MAREVSGGEAVVATNVENETSPADLCRDEVGGKRRLSGEVVALVVSTGAVVDPGGRMLLTVQLAHLLGQAAGERPSRVAGKISVLVRRVGEGRLRGRVLLDGTCRGLQEQERQTAARLLGQQCARCVRAKAAMLAQIPRISGGDLGA